MKIVVTGGSGFVGRYLIKKLLKEGHSVINIDIKDWYPPNINNYKLIKMSITSSKLKDAIPKGSVIVHLATIQYATLKKRLPVEILEKVMYKTIFLGTKNLIEIARLKKIKKFIFISTDMVYGIPKTLPISEEHNTHPLGPYGRYKLMAEKLLKKTKLNYVIIRPRFIIGPERRGVLNPIFYMIKYSLPIPLIGGGKNIYQMISIYDLVDLIDILIKKEVPSGIYNLGSDKYDTLYNHFQKLINDERSKSIIIPIPGVLVKIIFRYLIYMGIPVLYREQYEIADKNYFLSTKKIKNVTNWKPKYTDYQMILITYKKFQEGKK